MATNSSDKDQGDKRASDLATVVFFQHHQPRFPQTGIWQKQQEDWQHGESCFTEAPTTACSGDNPKMDACPLRAAQASSPPEHPLQPLSPCSPAPARGRVCLAEALQAAGLGTAPLSSGDVLQGPGAQRVPGEAGWALEPGTRLLTTLPGFRWVPRCFVKTISYRLGLAKVD